MLPASWCWRGRRKGSPAADGMLRKSIQAIRDSARYAERVDLALAEEKFSGQRVWRIAWLERLR